MASEREIRDLVRRVVDGLAPADDAVAPESGTSESIAIGADHGGYALKERLIAHLTDQGRQVCDCGTDSPDSVDYPDFALAVAELVANGSCRWGVVIDGAGIGSCITANKVPGVRAALCYDISSARNSREHNLANVLTLGAALIGEGLAMQILDVWLATAWGSGRHARRVEKITEIDRRYRNISMTHG